MIPSMWSATFEHPLFDSFLREFRAGRYFEAHEVLEELWILEERPARGPLRGLVQLAVACEHYRRGNRGGARGVFVRARANLLDGALASGQGETAIETDPIDGLDRTLRRYERILVEGRPEPLPGLNSVFWN